MRNSSVDASVLSKSNSHSTCPWKGEASYYSITLDSKPLFWARDMVSCWLASRDWAQRCSLVLSWAEGEG